MPFGHNNEFKDWEDCQRKLASKYPNQEARDKVCGKLKSETEDMDKKNYILYHETPIKNISSIKEKGLKPPSHVNPAKWFMLTNKFEGALEYRGGQKERAILEYHIPKEKANKYLWLKASMESETYGKQIGIKKPIKEKYLRQIHSEEGKGRGWWGESERHSKARKEGHADFSKSVHTRITCLEKAYPSTFNLNQKLLLSYDFCETHIDSQIGDRSFLHHVQDLIGKKQLKSLSEYTHLKAIWNEVRKIGAPILHDSKKGVDYEGMLYLKEVKADFIPTNTYYCTKCQSYHYYTSEIGKAHRKYTPKNRLLDKVKLLQKTPIAQDINYPETAVMSSVVHSRAVKDNKLYVKFHSDPSHAYKYQFPDNRQAEKAFHEMVEDSPGRWAWKNLRGHTKGEPTLSKAKTPQERKAILASGKYGRVFGSSTRMTIGGKGSKVDQSLNYEKIGKIIAGVGKVPGLEKLAEEMRQYKTGVKGEIEGATSGEPFMVEELKKFQNKIYQEKNKRKAINEQVQAEIEKLKRRNVSTKETPMETTQEKTPYKESMKGRPTKKEEGKVPLNPTVKAKTKPKKRGVKKYKPDDPYGLPKGITPYNPTDLEDTKTEKGHWITIGGKSKAEKSESEEDDDRGKGRHVYIREGETLKQAVDRMYGGNPWGKKEIKTKSQKEIREKHKETKKQIKEHSKRELKTPKEVEEYEKTVKPLRKLRELLEKKLPEKTSPRQLSMDYNRTLEHIEFHKRSIKDWENELKQYKGNLEKATTERGKQNWSEDITIAKNAIKENYERIEKYKEDLKYLENLREKHRESMKEEFHTNDTLPFQTRSKIDDKIYVHKELFKKVDTQMLKNRVNLINRTYRNLPDSLKDSVHEIRIVEQPSLDVSYHGKNLLISGFYSIQRGAITVGVGSESTTNDWIEQVVIHEAAHALDFQKIDFKDRNKINDLFKRNMMKLISLERYAAQDEREFFAECYYHARKRNISWFTPLVKGTYEAFKEFNTKYDFSEFFDMVEGKMIQFSYTIKGNHVFGRAKVPEEMSKKEAQKLIKEHKAQWVTSKNDLMEEIFQLEQQLSKDYNIKELRQEFEVLDYE